jgi:F-type H+-transporting ATPase subunit delta
LAEKDVYKAYAGALFDIGLQNNTLDYIEQDFKTIIQLLSSDNDLELFLSSYVIPSDKKKVLIDKLFSDKLSSDIICFLKVLIDNDRQSLISDIYSNFIEITDEHNNRKRIKIITAVKLSREIIEEIERVISGKLKMNIILVEEIDDTLIGGFKMKIDDTVIDGSIARDIASLKAQLIETELGSGIIYED